MVALLCDQYILSVDISKLEQVHTMCTWSPFRTKFDSSTLVIFRNSIRHTLFAGYSAGLLSSELTVFVSKVKLLTGAAVQEEAACWARKKAITYLGVTCFVDDDNEVPIAYDVHVCIQIQGEGCCISIVVTHFVSRTDDLNFKKLFCCSFQDIFVDMQCCNYL